MKFFTIKALLISFCFITFSCEKKERLGNDISILTPGRNLSTSNGTDIYTSDLQIEPDTSDTLRFKLTENDWAILRESFDKNQIILSMTIQKSEREYILFICLIGLKLKQIKGSYL